MSEAARESRRAGRLTASPAIFLLFVWMIVPLAMTVYFSTQNYLLLDPDTRGFAGLENYTYFLSSSSFLNSLLVTLMLVGSVLALTVGLGVLISVLVDTKFPGQGVVRMLLISPFFIMPTVSALIWKNLLMNPVSGLFAWMFQLVGLTPINWFSDWPLLSVIIIVTWEWLPFAILIFVTSLQSMDQEQKEAAQMDGATPLSIFRYLTLPHLARPIAVVVMVEAIFLLNIFAEIFTTTSGGPGDSTTNLPYLVFTQALLEFDVGTASAGGLVAVVLANVVAALLLRVFGKSLTQA
ncbi:carbohydrate ABC transporter permease [Hyalangium minutum]|uniref:Various polyols ABC transporter, permease component 1 n=1 Tax=Hyalangium minutum TaxID=394096 RepID=A0A085WNC7_9BACT|nr:sugar ABC transporter permease [Hyalangium minutum]KFE69190.1 Various polyols ABC transporter, permease component 1 [Hyalangium minutum]